MQTGDREAQASKRMRLGTRSCTECRRRKVRCTFAQGQGRCRQCITHDAQCRSQDTAGPNLRDDESDQLRMRLENVEEMFRMVCRSIDQEHRTPDPTRAVGRHAGNPGLTVGVMTPRDSTEGHDAHAIEDGDIFVNAPLVRLLRGTLAAQLRAQSQPWPPSQATRVNLSSIQHLIPDGRSLRCVLQSTQRFWSIWPLAGDMTRPEEGYSLQAVPDALRFVDESLASTSAGVVAKCLVWLCLCLQQLPKDFEETTARLPLRASDLICCYIEKVDSVVLNQSTVCDMDCIEAMVLQYKVFVNMGRPQRAWKCTRNALDNAILLGIHRMDGDASPRRRRLWTALWQHDRHLALFLGLPYTVPEQYINSGNEILTDSVESRILHHLNMICGYVVDRDQLQRGSSYSATARIVEEIDKLEEMIPEHWSTSSFEDQSIPLGVPFWRQALILLFHFTNQLVHLPYAQAAAGDKKHAYSRSVAYQSAETIIESYQAIRTFDGVPIICDFIDFCAFSAALLLAIDLVSEGTQRSLQESDRLWALIVEFSTSMRHTASVLECSVAAQSAQVLEYIYAARHGAYTEPEDYEVTIPFFGQVKIRRSRSQMQDLVSNAISHHQVAQASNLRNTIEFNSNIFNFRAPLDFQTPYELGDNWFNSRASFDNTYDWNGAFEFH